MNKGVFDGLAANWKATTWFARMARVTAPQGKAPAGEAGALHCLCQLWAKACPISRCRQLCRVSALSQTCKGA